MDVTKEQINAAIDLLATMVVADIAEEEHRDASDVLPDFLLSHTGKMLYNEKNKLWWDGPAMLEDMYRKESVA
jgi:hypothetical protein